MPEGAATAAAEVAAAALHLSMSQVMRRLRQTPPASDDLTTPETSALSKLDRGGPRTSAELARLEQISAQSMGATLSALADRGLIERSPDPQDGRRVTISINDAGRGVLRERRSARTQQIAAGLARGFTPAELRQLTAVAPLIERLAQQL
jgi:DNA-binding MarR family transcriptional regulator